MKERRHLHEWSVDNWSTIRTRWTIVYHHFSHSHPMLTLVARISAPRFSRQLSTSLMYVHSPTNSTCLSLINDNSLSCSIALTQLQNESIALPSQIRQLDVPHNRFLKWGSCSRPLRCQQDLRRRQGATCECDKSDHNPSPCGSFRRKQQVCEYYAWTTLGRMKKGQEWVNAVWSRLKYRQLNFVI